MHIARVGRIPAQLFPRTIYDQWINEKVNGVPSGGGIQGIGYVKLQSIQKGVVKRQLVRQRIVGSHRRDRLGINTAIEQGEAAGTLNFSLNDTCL